MDIVIRTGTLEEVFGVCTEVPEFQSLRPIESYQARLDAAQRSLILIACVNGQPVGFKVGYEKHPDGSFYSWMGGVDQSYRRMGIAQQLLDAMENWARGQGYHTLRFKTRNSLKPMLLFGIRNGFDIYTVSPRDSLSDYRIHLQKTL